MTEIDSTLSEQPPEQLYGHDGSSIEKRTWVSGQDLVNRVLAGVIVLCAIGLMLLLAVPLLALIQSILGINLPAINNIVEWLAGGSKGLILALVLVVTGSLSYVYLRHRLLHDIQLYSESGCPRCQEHELIRVRRQRSDRLIARFGIPVHRHVCRNCAWDGLRIGGSFPGPYPVIDEEETLA